MLVEQICRKGGDWGVVAARMVIETFEIKHVKTKGSQQRKKVTKLRTLSVPPLAPPPRHLRTLMGVFFLKARTDDSRHLAKKPVCYHSWENLSFSLEIHKFWCQVITFGG